MENKAAINGFVFKETFITYDYLDKENRPTNYQCGIMEWWSSSGLYAKICSSK